MPMSRAPSRWSRVFALVAAGFLPAAAAAPVPAGAPSSPTAPAPAAKPVDGNRLAYLDDPCTPYHVGRGFPKLTTPMWVGEEGVDAVVVLAIDDMRDSAKYEKFCRPILDRLKQIDGRAALSIMTCKVDPKDPQLQAWLKEGVSLEAHTAAHPCPILRNNDLAAAKLTYDECVDQLRAVPGNHPVAFRTPCCDSRNTVSPRTFTEIIAKRTPNNAFLTLDSSVMNLITPNDPDLPRDLVFNADGTERFRRYLPASGFVNVIEDYPYPYLIGGSIWEFPCVTPSDWSAQNLQKPFNPRTVEDWKAALDAAVVKQGTFNLIFHPHNWIKPEQVVELIDHAVAKHGRRVKFLTFKECQERIDKHLLLGNPVRRPVEGGDNGVRLLDVNGDGYMDVLIANEHGRRTRIWSPDNGKWLGVGLPFQIGSTDARSLKGWGSVDVRFGVFDGGQVGAAVFTNAGWPPEFFWRFDGERWVKDASLCERAGGQPKGGAHLVRFRDVDGDGVCELVVLGGERDEVFRRGEFSGKRAWTPAAVPPPIASRAGWEGWSGTAHLVDVDEDGRLDLLVSFGRGSWVFLFEGWEKGWTQHPAGPPPPDAAAYAPTLTAPPEGHMPLFPPLFWSEHHQGFFRHGRSIVWQNETTFDKPDLVEVKTFNDLLGDKLPGPKSPAASLKSMQARPGFEVQLVAAEPLVQDPVAFAFGPDGKLWVVEMGDYPLGVDGKPGGRVKVLTDTDGDGVYDKAVTFLDKLPFPSGVTPYRKGVLITAAPDILYAEDTDGDGVADKREVLFTGFGEGNQQHRVNGLWMGLDGWFYAANGHSNGKIKSLKTGKEVDVRNRDVRVKPDTGEIEAVTGVTQFGRTRDDFDRWFGNDNSHPLFHFALDDRYLRRNPNAAPPPARLEVPETPGAGPVYPVSRTLARFNDFAMANHFTSACSPTFYRDDLFGEAFAGSVFISEPVHNLVSRVVTKPQGVTFRGARAPDERDREFLASTDNWFRPTMTRVGPDGALYVADMYRLVIEHPQWIPKEWQAKLDLRAGHDMGRIYRIAPVGSPRRAVPKLSEMTGEQLAAAMDSPSGWQRDTAQQLIVERQDKLAVAGLSKLARAAKSPSVRAQALCTLDGLSAIPPELLAAALKDEHAGVRQQAVRLAESTINHHRAVAAGVAAAATDADPFVRLQAAYTLGAWRAPTAGEALAAVLLGSEDDPLVRAAAASSLSADNLEATLKALGKRGDGKAPPPSPALLSTLTRMVTAAESASGFAALVDAVTAKRADGSYDDWQFDAVAAITTAARGRTAYLGPNVIAKTGASFPRMKALVDAARAVAADDGQPLARRRSAAEIIGVVSPLGTDGQAAIDRLLSPGQPGELQAAAVRAIARAGDGDVQAAVLAGWPRYTPAVRAAALDALLAKPAWAAGLLDAVEKGTVRPADVDAARRQVLLKSTDPAVRTRAQKLLADAVNPDRQKAVEAARPALALQGDPARGADVFARTCAACHQVAGGKGNAVGPDLAAVGDKSPEGLLVAIVDPNRAVEPRYVAYTVETKAGDSLTGLLTTESGEAITLLGPDGRQQQVLRSDVKDLRTTGLSLMPEGLEAGLKPQELADLIAHVRAARPTGVKKTFPGNAPAVVLPKEGGTLALLPATAEISGAGIVLEAKHKNLGFWQSEADQAAWAVQPARAGTYDVYLDYACERPNHGNTVAVQVGSGQAADAKVSWKVEPTENWDAYRRVEVGRLKLDAGRQRVTVRSDGAIKGALLDLRGVELVPVP
ncbi:MAG TPA: PVC-type heme-binding CxxCH protein [Humisphaera sp.]